MLLRRLVDAGDGVEAAGTPDVGQALGHHSGVELRTLHYFLTVVREQSISAAAESPHLSQPALSPQLKRMTV